MTPSSHVSHKKENKFASPTVEGFLGAKCILPFLCLLQQIDTNKHVRSRKWFFEIKR